MAATKVFLSLSYVDRNFVSQVRQRLPAGVAYFYEESFDNGELLLKAMERAVNDTAIFVLFASKAGVASPWVGFEIAQARVQLIKNQSYRILVFPTDPNVSISDLPEWLRAFWITKSGYTPSDVARYITGVLLEPSHGLSKSAIRVVGRGKALDALEHKVADHYMRNGNAPSVFVLSGVRGVGRRTFAQYYMRTAMTADANLTFGPLLTISPQADIADLHRALWTEISPVLDEVSARKQYEAFQSLDESEQIAEVVRMMGHFSALGQAISVVSASGFLEDKGEPKSWVAPLFKSIPKDTRLFVITNRQFLPEFIDKFSNVVQMRVDELTDRDIKAMMAFTASRIGLENFTISDDLVKAIGGHADVANAAVRLASVKGTHILNRDPRQLFNVQNTILGESIEGGAITPLQQKILCLLSWVPALNGNVLEAVLLSDGESVDSVLSAIEDLMLGCIVVSVGPAFSISPAIRSMFRRANVTPPKLLQMLSAELSRQWKEAEDQENVRLDLIETFVFMYSLEGASLPKELRSLITPGMLHDLVREAYARGKEPFDSASLHRVVRWSDISRDIKMSEATREEILSYAVRAKIRLGQYGEADKVLNEMASRRYRSVPFLRGHSYRRQEQYEKAAEMLEIAVKEKKNKRSAVHELALTYKKAKRLGDLKKLLEEHGRLISDSAMFADFQVGVDLARGDLRAAELGIDNLRRLPDDNGRSDIRSAQLLMRRDQYQPAIDCLNRSLLKNHGQAVRIRSLRSICAAKLGRIDAATQDIEFVDSIPTGQSAAIRLRAELLIARGQPVEAKALIDNLPAKGPEDWKLYARALEAESNLPSTPIDVRLELRSRMTKIREEHKFVLEYDFDDELE